MNTKTVHGRLRPGRRFLKRPDGVVREHIPRGWTANVQDGLVLHISISSKTAAPLNTN